MPPSLSDRVPRRAHRWIGAALLLPAVAGCGSGGQGPDKPPEAETLPWSRLAGKMANNRRLVFLRNGRLAYCRESTVCLDGSPALQGVACGDGFSWSPDGATLVVTGNPESYSGSSISFLLALWSVSLADRAGRMIFLSPNPPTPIGLRDQVFSPDGTRVAFALEFGNGPPNRAIWTVGADGAAPQRISFGRWDDSPAWSPDGRQIAYHSDAGVMLVNADGTSAVSLGFDGELAWSP